MLRGFPRCRDWRPQRCSCREVIRCFLGELGPVSVMPLVLLGALKLAVSVVLVDHGMGQAAVRYSLMSPAQAG